MSEETTRCPIVSVLGHVDHGKSSILDAIRGTNILATEAGAITQAIGASIIPLDTIQQKCGTLLDSLNMKFNIPGILFIDTPGHAAFTTLRKRGGNLADIAILVVDIKEGFKPQTIEAIEILKSFKTPFIIAANKLDLVPGFRKQGLPLLQEINQQDASVVQTIDTRLYELVGQIHENFELNAERFDRVDDYTQQVAIVPCSAKENIGIAELLMVITGLAQRFLEQNLQVDVCADAKGTILEVKEEQGLGKTMDVIIYNGNLKVNNPLVIGTLEGEPIVTKVKAMFEPSPLNEMRDKKSKFKSVKEVEAATGVKISCPDMDGVIAGMPVMSAVCTPVEQVKDALQKEIQEVIVETDKKGIIIKADTLGSLEALIKLLKEKNFTIRKAEVGDITKKDYMDAESNFEEDPLLAVILGFNVKDAANLCHDNVKVLTSDIIYKLIEGFEVWQDEEKKRLEAQDLDVLVRPCKLEFLPNCCFRQNNPAIIGVEVITGVLKTATPLMKADGRALSQVKSIQADKENLQVLNKGRQAAISLPNVTIGRQIEEGDIFYSDIPEDDFRQIKKLTKYLSKPEIEVLKQIAEIKRKERPLWGV